MDSLITNWEMSFEAEQQAVTREEIANWPSEPYVLDRNGINWN
ncbi:MAG TPA: hypothetical protein VFR58_07075 [Flavisolibacter sp.]|nr:hypothetical protein [Flavisolibacter sp.]